MSKFTDWLDHRTGYRALLHEALYENIPGGARWRYVWGSTLVFAFTVQLITGVFLWMAYSPSDNTAWESVYYIQTQMEGGWLLRGIHHFMAQAMVVLLGLHLMQVVWDGAYKAPREVNFWVGLILMLIVLGLSLTGYLLPWDQKGYWATAVATNLSGLTPAVGAEVQTLVVGGEKYGHHTLTRFFALHAGVLPGLLIALLVVHLAVFRRHGLHAKQPVKRADQAFWPDQVLKDAIACLAVLAVVLVLSFYFKGAELYAPADGAKEYSAARPEWYFLFLFQFLKLFEGYGETGEFLGAIVIPGLVMLVLFLMPLTGRARAGHWFNVAFILLLLGGAGFLTYEAIKEDMGNQDHANAVWVAHQNRDLALHLAEDGIPAQGHRYQMRNHPKAVALTTLTETCLACHGYSDSQGYGFVLGDRSAAPNLHGFGTRDWVKGLLDPKQVDGPDYFGNTALKEGSMVTYVKEDMQDPENGYTPEVIEQIAVALAAEAGHEPETQADKERLEKGRAILSDEEKCAQCHKFHDVGYEGSAPDLTGWGSREWLIGMISNPNAERFYGHAFSTDVDSNQQLMPAFGHVADAEFPTENLSPEIIGYMADWLRGELIPREAKSSGTTASTSTEPAPAASDEDTAPNEDPTKAE